MSHGLVFTARRLTLSALSQRLPLPLRRVQQSHVFQRATIDTKSIRSIQNSSNMSTFVLDEYNNVSVATSDLPKDAVKDLTKDELKEWAPFKV